MTPDVPPAPVEKVIVQESVSHDASSIDSKIAHYALKWNVSMWLLDHIAREESHYGKNKVGDTSYVCTARKSPRYGQVAPSHGITQISSCWHPEISYEEAMDDDFALDWTAKQLSLGKCHEWSTCPL